MAKSATPSTVSVAEFNALQSTVNTLADSMAQLVAHLTAQPTAPIAQQFAQAVSTRKATPKTQREIPAVSPAADWKKRKNAIKRARKLSIAEHGLNSAETVALTCDYRDVFIEGFNAGYWDPSPSANDGRDFTGFWANMVNGAWSQLQRGTVPTPVGNAQREQRMPTPNPTANTAIANVTRTGRKPMQLSDAERQRRSDQGKKLAATRAAKRATESATRHEHAVAIVDTAIATARKARKTSVNLDTVDAESAADREARKLQAFIGTLTPAQRAAYEETTGVKF